MKKDLLLIIIAVIVAIILIGLCYYESPLHVDAFLDANRCGVDLPSCSGKGVRCMNGYCGSDSP